MLLRIYDIGFLYRGQGYSKQYSVVASFPNHVGTDTGGTVTILPYHPNRFFSNVMKGTGFNAPTHMWHGFPISRTGLMEAILRPLHRF